jgi:hypothetical protein
MPSFELVFDIGTTNPDHILTALEEADTEQEFILDTCGSQLTVSSQIDHTEEEVRQFVDGALNVPFLRREEIE